MMFGFGIGSRLDQIDERWLKMQGLLETIRAHDRVHSDAMADVVKQLAHSMERQTQAFDQLVALAQRTSDDARMVESRTRGIELLIGPITDALKKAVEDGSKSKRGKKPAP